jgi:hypothetical protein
MMRKMRRIYRRPLPTRIKTYLKKRQAVVKTGEPVQRTWSTARRTKTLRNVFETLVVMAGARARCYFCNDSRGTDIEHFWPKSRYPERVFEWPNMLLVCSGCNRQKQINFRSIKTVIHFSLTPQRKIHGITSSSSQRPVKSWLAGTCKRMPLILKVPPQRMRQSSH